MPEVILQYHATAVDTATSTSCIVHTPQQSKPVPVHQECQLIKNVCIHQWSPMQERPELAVADPLTCNFVQGGFIFLSEQHSSLCLSHVF